MTLPEDTILVNRYRIDGLLAHGGMGAIYRAFDTNLSTPVAIKENFFQTPQGIAQFKQEALILARLRHPALPRVIDHFSFEDQQYLVMDFIEGENLWEIVRRRGEPLDEKQALDYTIQVCQAISYLHRQKPPIIHRDIKPQNIKITPEGRAVLVDFGIAKQVTGQDSRTQTGAQGVTPGFSPPEQYSGVGTQPVSDIYSLGATLYAVLTGKQPPISISLMVGNVKFTPPNVINPKLSQKTTQAILFAMQVEPKDRPQSVADWQRDLEIVVESISSVDPDKEATWASRAKQKVDKDKTTVSPPAKPATAATSYWLVDSTGLGYPIGPEPLVIGRHSESDVVVEDLNVSRHHARLRVDGQRCFVLDEGSANGTFLNGHRLHSEWYPFNPGDVLVVGPARFHLTATQPVKLAPPKQKAMPIAGDGSTTVPSPAEKTAAQPASPPALQPKPKRFTPLIIALLVVLLAVVGLGGYYLVNLEIFPALASFLNQGGPATREAPRLTQTQTAEAIATETVEVAARLTAQAKDNAEATSRAKQAVTQTAQANLVATPTPESTATPTPRPTTVTNTPTLTVTPTRPTPTATPTRTPTTRPTRAVPIVSGPTVIPLKSTVTVDQLGSQEVIDVDINPKNPREVYALVKRDGIYKSSNGGDGPWTRIDLDGEAITAFVIDPANPARLYAPTWNAVLKSTDGGNTWEPKTNGLVANRVVDVVTVHPSNPAVLYAGIGETLVVSTDEGENWSSLGYSAGLGVARLYQIVVDPFNDETIYVGGLAASVYKSTDGGRNFIQLRFNTGQGTFGLAAHPAQSDVYLAGINAAEAGIIKTDNGFDFRWASKGLIFGGADSAYSAITYAPSDPNIVYAGSGYESNRDAKGIFKSTDGGESWNPINKGLAINPDTGFPYYVKSMAVHPTNADIVFAATGAGLYQSSDGGANWHLK